MKGGFTLMELMVVVGITAIMALAGSMVLSKTLGSRTFNTADSNITNHGMQALLGFERSIKYQRIVTLVSGGTTYTRSDCNSAGSAGVSGSVLNTDDKFGSSTYLLNSGALSSQSGVTTEKISNTDLVVSNLSFTWFCSPSYFDRVRVSFDGAISSQNGTFWTRNFVKEVNMYNSYK